MSLAAAQHRRGHSTGSMSSSKERDEDLALFHEMKARERNNFLHPSTEDIESSLRYRIVATPPPPAPKGNDLLGLEPEKNDYDWLLTPPGTPLFPSLEEGPKEHRVDAVSVRAATRSTRPSRTSRGSSSPSRRPSSPSSSTTGNLNRRASFGNSSPSRPISAGNTRSSTPTNTRSAAPAAAGPTGRSSTPTNRRSLTPSSSFNSNNTSNPNARRAARSSSPSRKPRAPAVHPAMPVDFGDAPPNLRTSMPDRPASNTRGASLSPRLGSGSSGFKAPERRAVSPSLSRSFSSSASSSKGSVISSYNSGVEVSTRPRVNTEVAGKRPSSGHGETSPVKPVTKKPVRMTGTNSFSAPSSHRRPFDNSSVRQMDFRRNSTSGFRPLMSNSHISSFYSRASSSLQHRSSLSVNTDSSINSSSVASVHESDHEDEAISRPMEIVADEAPTVALVGDQERKGVTSEEQQDDDIEMALSWRPGGDEDDAEQEKGYDMLLVATPTSSEAVYSTDFQDEDMEIECEPSPSLAREYEESVRSLLELVISEAVELAEDKKKLQTYQPSEAPAPDPVAETHSIQPDESSELKPRDSPVHCFSQLIDPKYSSSSIEVYQFDQELHTTGSEVDSVVQQSHHSRSSSRDYSPSTSAANHHDLKSSTATATTNSSSSSAEHHPKAELQHSSSKASATASKPAPSFSIKQHFGTHLSRKRESRESSLFSIQISSSKGESISSGRPASTDGTHSSMDDTPRRFHEVGCNGGPYKAYDEYDTKSEESCVDYYIDSMETKKFVEVEKAVSRETISNSDARSSPRVETPPKDHHHRSFETDEDGFVDYYIDEFSPQQKKVIVSCEKTLPIDAGHGMDMEKSMSRPEDRSPGVFPEEDDDTHIEVCSMDDSEPGAEEIHPNSRAIAAVAAAAAIDEEIDTMTECWKQLEEMDCDASVPAETQGDPAEIPTGSCEFQSLSETRDSILLCSSIVHDIVYKAASLGMEKEDLKALATPASADELVTFLGLSKQIGSSFMDLDASVGAGNRWKSEESTVRRTLTYMQNQKLMQNTTVAYMQQSPVGRVEEDVKDHIIPEHHFIDRSLERRDNLRLERKAKVKCKCTIL